MIIIPADPNSYLVYVNVEEKTIWLEPIVAWFTIGDGHIMDPLTAEEGMLAEATEGSVGTVIRGLFDLHRDPLVQAEDQQEITGSVSHPDLCGSLEQIEKFICSILPGFSAMTAEEHRVDLAGLFQLREQLRRNVPNAEVG